MLSRRLRSVHRNAVRGGECRSYRRKSGRHRARSDDDLRVFGLDGALLHREATE